VLYERPIHPYSVALLSAVPIPDPKANAERTPVVLEGDVPSPVNPPSACRFHTRCPWATEICSQDEPPLAEYSEGQAAACHHPRNVNKGQMSRTEVAPDSPESASEVLPGAEPTAAASR
jgi:oligopeptide transport system ATP-binding protein